MSRIEREGQSDIFCACDMTIEEALVTALTLENTLHEVQGRFDFNHSFIDGFANSDDSVS